MMKTTRDFPAAHDGTAMTAEDGRAVIRFERHLAHPIERVWSAVADPGEIVGWLAHRVEITPEVGGRYSLWLGDSRSVSPDQHGTIDEIEPPHVLQATFDDGSTIRFELSATTGGTTLVFTDNRPAGERADFSVFAGWHLRMDLLPKFLDGVPADWPALDADRTENGAVAAIEEIFWHYYNQHKDNQHKQKRAANP